MDNVWFSENQLNQMSPKKRIEAIQSQVKESDDETERWDAMVLASELYHKSDSEDPIRGKVIELLRWMIKHETNSVILHEISYQISARNMRELIPDIENLVKSTSDLLVIHEALENLGLMNAFEVEDLIKLYLTHPEKFIRETASFALKRMERYRDTEYQALEIA